ncbi:MAG TPA: PLP-dependent transferase [Thermoanaerobaculia bacterium]|nr:PLP-dependent transferase [Thermoanaerobaculia bacterium]
MNLSTRCVRSCDPRDPYSATSPPIYQTATFRQPTATELGEYDYSRTSNPTRALFEEQIAALEGGRFGLAFASGMAALAAVTRLVASGDEILAGDDLYGGTARLLSRVAPRQGIAVRYVDATDAAQVAAALGPATRLLLVESPGNPLLGIADLPALAALARERDVLLAVDNSLLTPLLQRPLELGAHLVVASTTKFLGGHSDTTGGMVAVGDEPGLAAELAFNQNAEGTALAPFECWLLLRGLKTLSLRLERQCRTAAALAELLAAHPAVSRVYYPALADPASRLVHRRQATGDGAVLSFTTGDAERSRRLVAATRLFTLAVSFGSVTSTLSLPCTMSHASVPAELRERLAPPPDLVRLSVGIEDPDDLRADLEQALAAAVDAVEPDAGSEPQRESRRGVQLT